MTHPDAYSCIPAICEDCVYYNTHIHTHTSALPQRLFAAIQSIRVYLRPGLINVQGLKSYNLNKFWLKGFYNSDIRKRK